MSDAAFLRDFSVQPAKPVTNQLSNLSGSYADTDAKLTKSSNLPAAPRVEAPNPVMATRLTSATTERFTNPPVEKEAEVSDIKESEPAATEELKEAEPEVPNVTPNQVGTQKFGYMYGVVGEVPKGYKAAAACCNCKYSDGYCTKYNFPIAGNYSCDDFEVIPVPEMYSNKMVDLEEPASATIVTDKMTEVDLSPLDQALVLYESVLSTLADGDLAGDVLNKVVERFSNRSEYADAFLRLKYRRAYEDKHGSLEGAFLVNEEGN